MHSVVIMICVENQDFMATHMWTSGAKSGDAIPTPSLSVLTHVIADRLPRPSTTRGIALRDATQDALVLFPTLVLGPHRRDASSSNVKSEVDARLDLTTSGVEAKLAISPYVQRSSSCSPDIHEKQDHTRNQESCTSGRQELVCSRCQPRRKLGHRGSHS
jgi:hypothetical protein